MCDQEGITRIKYKCGFWSYITCFLMQFVCGPFGLVAIIIDDCKDIYHECPHCGSLVGITIRINKWYFFYFFFSFYLII